MKVGVIGLGRMGSAIARRILNAGFETTVYNRTADKAQSLAAHGAGVASSVTELSHDRDLVISMVSDDSALYAITSGPGGLYESMNAGAIHAAMGTHSVDAVNNVAEAHRVKGQSFISTPVLGRPEAVDAGELGIVAGGDNTVIDRCMPVFEGIGKRVFRAGPRPAAAAALKLSNNFLLACCIETLAETFAVARRYEIDQETLVDVITNGLFASPAYKIYARLIADKAYDKAGFTATLGLKDLNLMCDAAMAANIPLPSVNAVREHLVTALANGWQDLDWSVVARVQALNSGFEN